MQDSFRNSALNPGSLLVFTSEFDPSFYGGVVLLLAHDQRGTLGVLINKPDSMSTYKNFLTYNEDIDVLAAQDERQRVLLSGGPVEHDGRVFILHENSQGGLSYIDNTSPDVIERATSLAAQRPAAARVAFCYTGWMPGGLENEVKAGAWRVLPYDGDLVFRTDFADIWPKAAKKAGLHDDLARYIVDPEPLREAKGGTGEALKYLETIRPAPGV